MFGDEFVEDFLQSGSADLLEFVTDFHNGLFDLDETRQVDRSFAHFLFIYLFLAAPGLCCYV